MTGDAARSASKPVVPSRRAWLMSCLRLVLGIALCALLFAWLRPTLSDIPAMTSFSPGFASVSLAGTAVAVLATAARWMMLHQAMSADRMPFRIYVHTLTLTRLLGQMSSVMLADLVGRGVALQASGSGERLGRLAVPIVLERFIDVLLPLAYVGWMLTAPLLPWPPWLLALGITLLVTALLGPLLRPASLLLLRLSSLLRRRQHQNETLPSLELPLRHRYGIVLLGLLRFAAILIQFYGAGAAVGVVLPPTSLLGATAVSQLGAVIAITPGGLGFVEAGWAGGLRWFGHGDEAIAIFAVATRFFMFVNFGVLTLLTWAWTRTSMSWERPQR